MIIGSTWPSALSIPTALLSSLSLILVVLYRYFYQVKVWTQKTTRKIPGPWGLPVIGHLLRLGPTPHLQLTKWARQYGNVFQIRLGGHQTVVISGSELIMDTLMSKGGDVAGRPDFASFRIINGGVNMTFTSYGPLWKIKRSIMHKSVTSYMQKGTDKVQDIIYKETDKLINGLLDEKSLDKELCHTLSKHASSFMQRVCFSTACETEEEIDQATEEIIGLFEKIMKISLVVSVVDIFPFTARLFPKQMATFRRLNQILISLVEKHQSRNIDSYSPGEVRDFTDGIIRATEQMKQSDLENLDWSRPEIMRLMVDLLGAGQNAIASNLRWLCLYMILHPDVQARVHEEIRTVIGSRRPTMEDEKSMPYTSAVMLESRRLSVMFPVLVPHSTTCDTEIGGFFVPKDTILLFNMWSASRDTELWDQPERFLPERFLDRATGLVDPKKRNAYLSFGAGKRRCIGEKLGASSVFLFFTGLMQRVWLSPTPEHAYTLKGDFGFVYDTALYTSRVDPNQSFEE